MTTPLVINTRDGVCWTRRTVTAGGIALYAPESVRTCPEFVMATLPELAEHGIVGSAYALPVPVGPEPRTLDVVEDELTGARLSLWEEEQAYERLRVALESAKRGRREARARVAELEARLAEYERPADEDPIAYALTGKAEAAAPAETFPAHTSWQLEVLDGGTVWVGTGLRATDRPGAEALLSKERDERPDLRFRLVRSTTTRAVEPGSETGGAR
ncbi:hypothetical protein ACIG0D_01890 [Streptomyces sp. NPDC052773]|uniref:hypothetical protein n=1 Tax=Streptomyces sp. NPDC052773 TaxID=3365693 RepID=UPI0037D6E193